MIQPLLKYKHDKKDVNGTGEEVEARNKVKTELNCCKSWMLKLQAQRASPQAALLRGK